MQLVGVVALAFFFENYDISMLSAALKQIRESFGLDQATMTEYIAYIRLGAIPAFLVLPLADRIGRRRVFLGAVVGMSVGTLLSAFARTPEEFVVIQLVTRSFIVACIASSVVIVAEELPAATRGWGVGTLGAVGSLGYGLGALAYAFVEVLPFGWRALYLIGGLPLLLLPTISRRLGETQRFRVMQAEGATAKAGWFSPIRELLSEHPRRSLAVGGLGLFVAAGQAPAFGLISDFVQSERGWTPGSYSLMALVAGGFGIIGNSAIGALSDRFGRRPAGWLVYGVLPVSVFAIYFGPNGWIPIFWIPLIFLLTGGNVLMRALTAELFPTSSRNTAMGWETLMETLGASMGFLLVGLLGRQSGAESIGPAVFVVSLLTILGALIVWSLPETARQDLETTSGSKTSPPRARGD
jgi:putative MFS transporter